MGKNQKIGKRQDNPSNGGERAVITSVDETSVTFPAFAIKIKNIVEAVVSQAWALLMSLYEKLWVVISTQIHPLFCKWCTIEEGRLGLFAPVFFAIGIGIYFSASAEPRLIGGLFLMVLSFCIWMFLKSRGPLFYYFLLAFVWVSAGYCSSIIRTNIVCSPILKQEINYADVQGIVLRIENRDNGWRVLLLTDKIDDIDKNALPEKIRVNWRGADLKVEVGDFVGFRAGLSPPPPPVLPGGYDYARQLYFQKIGGVGYAVSNPVVITEGFNHEIKHDHWGFFDKAQLNFAIKAEKFRNQLFYRIQQAAPGQGGAILGAIVTGKREAISTTSQEALRNSGLAHLLAISGLHMGLATGLIFFSLRFFLVLNTSVALRYPIKKISAVAAMFAAAAYLIISGGGWSARRAFIMSSIIFIAIILDRRALSLRNVAIAAILILILTPEALLHPGFQMSFAAVTALIATYEWTSQRYQKKLAEGVIVNNFESQSFMAKLKRYGVAIAITDSVAAIATAPFALYHFHRTALYSLPANMLAMPIMGFWIMPFILVALFTMPFEIDGIFWKLAASGVELILAIGTKVASLPGAIQFTPSQSIGWLILMIFGGVWLCLLKAPWRLAGIVLLPLAIFVGMRQSTPDIFISNDGRNVGIYRQASAQDQFLTYDRRRGRFATQIWMESLGLDPLRRKEEGVTSTTIASKKRSVAKIADYYGCDDKGCVVDIKRQKIAISERPQTLAQDCQNSNIVIALFPVNRNLVRNCKARLIDRRNAWKDGAHQVNLDERGGAIIRSVSQERGLRPWVIN